MRVLIDACMPVQLAASFQTLDNMDVQTARDAKLNTLSDKALLAAMADFFDVLITMDKNIRYQQNLSRYEIAIIIVKAKSNALPALIPLVPKITKALEEIVANKVIEIS